MGEVRAEDPVCCFNPIAIHPFILFSGKIFFARLPEKFPAKLFLGNSGEVDPSPIKYSFELLGVKEKSP
jgi:hypothetical protein